MRNTLFLLFVLLSISQNSFSQIRSFEEKNQLKGWAIEKGKLKLSTQKAKLGASSLQIDWKSGAIVSLSNVADLEAASKSRKGGFSAWLYNTAPIDSELVLAFYDKHNKEVCKIDFNLNFKGWRAILVEFATDMGKSSNRDICSMKLLFPQGNKGGKTYIDYLEFQKDVTYRRMGDNQFDVVRDDYSFIPNIVKFGNAQPTYNSVVKATDKQIDVIQNRLREWFLGGGDVSHKYIDIRKKAETRFIETGLSRDYKLGTSLFPMSESKKIDGLKTNYFMDLNKVVLLPLALDYARKENKENLDQIADIYNWFNDQGWADGSSLGSIVLEKLRSSGYFYSLFLVKDDIEPHLLNRELETLKWMSQFGRFYEEPSFMGISADELRALCVPNLIYALSLQDKNEQMVALTAFQKHMNTGLSISDGYYGVIKSDYSGYHHRGAYNSAYYPDALNAGALIAYLLHDTPYSLSDQVMENLKQALLSFRFFCAGNKVPVGTTGRFPLKQDILHTILPAFGYLAYAYNEPDKELIAAAKSVMMNNAELVESYFEVSDSDLSYKKTMKEAEIVAQMANSTIEPESPVTGSRFMPYSGLLVAKSDQFHVNVKGFSQYIWDYESSSSENLCGRYLSSGQVEYFSLDGRFKSMSHANSSYAWSYIPGTTSVVFENEFLKQKRHNKKNGFTNHRNFSDETFLTGVTCDESSMFSFKMHDNAYLDSFRANKSVIVLNDLLVCLGSNISNNVTKNNTVTTLFQNIGSKKEISIRPVSGGTVVVDNHGVVYGVKGDVKMIANDSTVYAYIDHSKAPKDGDYLYFIQLNGDVKMIETLLSTNTVELLQANNDAHIIKKGDHTYASIYNANVEYNQPISKVNIPLSYILKSQGDGYQLNLCEPDMRRPKGKHMGDFTEEEIYVKSQPFTTKLYLNGAYQVTKSNVKVNVDFVSNQTILELQTVDGNNYQIELKKAD